MRGRAALCNRAQPRYFLMQAVQLCMMWRCACCTLQSGNAVMAGERGGWGDAGRQGPCCKTPTEEERGACGDCETQRSP